jgi:hypothetical protein
MMKVMQLYPFGCMTEVGRLSNGILNGAKRLLTVAEIFE